VESDGISLLVFKSQHTAGVKEIKQLLDFGKRLSKIVVREEALQA